MKTQIQSAQVILPCQDLDETLRFYVEDLGFAVDVIIPADDPQVAVVSGHGLSLRLEIGAAALVPKLRLETRTPLAPGQSSSITAPNGVEIELVPAERSIVVPPLNAEVVVTKLNDNDDWIKGRVGMRYRDLIPRDLSGRFGASHIHVADAGPLKDYVHYHRVRFQMIYCYKGWVKVVYEDQGPPFVLNEGDCVLQPPEIRHRVLESSGDLHVIELSCPRGHETHADRLLPLPNDRVNPQRDFGGQQFVRFQASDIPSWVSWESGAFEAVEFGIQQATQGLACAMSLKATGSHSDLELTSDSEFFFMFVVHGGVTLVLEGREPEGLAGGDSFVIPAGMTFSMSDMSQDLELLHVSVTSQHDS